MRSTLTIEHVLEQVPALLARVWREPVDSREGLAEALLAHGFPVQAEYDDGLDLEEEINAYLWITPRVSGLELGDEPAAEKRLRNTLSRTLGRAVGGDKHWDLGSFRVQVRLSRGELELRFTGQPSLALTRSVAEDWLAGMDGNEVAARHGLAEPGAEPSDLGFLPGPAWMSGGSLVRLNAEGRCDRISYFTDPGTMPPGVKAPSDDDAYEKSIAYLREGLGPCDEEGRLAPPRWTRGDRSFEYRRMHSRARTITFNEKPPRAQAE